MSIQSFAVTGYDRIWAPYLAQRVVAVCGVDGHRCAFCRMTVADVEKWKREHGFKETKGKS